MAPHYLGPGGAAVSLLYKTLINYQLTFEDL